MGPLKPALVLGTTWAWILVAAVGARADLVSWNFVWSPAAPIPPGVINPTAAPDAAVYADNANAGRVVLTAAPSVSVAGDSDIVAANLKVFSGADPNSPATLTNRAYSLALTLTDNNNGKSGSLTFTGDLNGSVSSLSSNVINAFTGKTVQTLTLGNDNFVVNMSSFTPPSPPGAGNLGSIGAHVTVISTPSCCTCPCCCETTHPPGCHVTNNPEPSTLTLAGLGLMLGIGICWWKHRTRNNTELGYGGGVMTCRLCFQPDKGRSSRWKPNLFPFLVAR
jgi:hypothetical protein